MHVYYLLRHTLLRLYSSSTRQQLLETSLDPPDFSAQPASVPQPKQQCTLCPKKTSPTFSTVAWKPIIRFWLELSQLTR